MKRTQFTNLYTVFQSSKSPRISVVAAESINYQQEYLSSSNQAKNKLDYNEKRPIVDNHGYESDALNDLASIKSSETDKTELRLASVQSGDFDDNLCIVDDEHTKTPPTTPVITSSEFPVKYLPKTASFLDSTRNKSFSSDVTRAGASRLHEQTEVEFFTNLTVYETDDEIIGETQQKTIKSAPPKPRRLSAMYMYPMPDPEFYIKSREIAQCDVDPNNIESIIGRRPSGSGLRAVMHQKNN